MFASSVNFHHKFQKNLCLPRRNPCGAPVKLFPSQTGMVQGLIRRCSRSRNVCVRPAGCAELAKAKTFLAPASKGPETAFRNAGAERPVLRWRQGPRCHEPYRKRVPAKRNTPGATPVLSLDTCRVYRMSGYGHTHIPLEEYKLATACAITRLLK